MRCKKVIIFLFPSTVDTTATESELQCDIFLLDNGQCPDKEICVIIDAKPICQ